jgi:hypothetical protein
MEGCGMNLQEIVEQVGGVFDVLALGRHDGVLFTRAELEELVALVEAQEREECAKIADKNADRCNKNSMAYMLLSSNADAIRARGKA